MTAVKKKKDMAPRPTVWRLGDRQASRYPLLSKIKSNISQIQGASVPGIISFNCPYNVNESRVIRSEFRRPPTMYGADSCPT